MQVNAFNRLIPRINPRPAIPRVKAPVHRHYPAGQACKQLFLVVLLQFNPGCYFFNFASIRIDGNRLFAGHGKDKCLAPDLRVLMIIIYREPGLQENNQSDHAYKLFHNFKPLIIALQWQHLSYLLSASTGYANKNLFYRVAGEILCDGTHIYFLGKNPENEPATRKKYTAPGVAEISRDRI